MFTRGSPNTNVRRELVRHPRSGPRRTRIRQTILDTSLYRVTRSRAFVFSKNLQLSPQPLVVKSVSKHNSVEESLL